MSFLTDEDPFMGLIEKGREVTNEEVSLVWHAWLRAGDMYELELERVVQNEVRGVFDHAYLIAQRLLQRWEHHRMIKRHGARWRQA